MSERKTLYVSPAGGSGLRILNIFECAKKTKLIADGWRPRLSPIYFSHGHIVHAHAEAPYPRFDKDDQPLPTAEVNPVKARDEMQDIIDKGEVFDELTKHTEKVEVKDKDKDIPRVVESQVAAWAQVMYPVEKVMMCEKRLKCDLIDPRTGQVNQEAADLDCKIVGRLDLGIKNENDELAFRDIKTSASPMKNDMSMFAYRFQLSGYRYAYAATEHKEVKDVAAFQLVKNKTLDGVLKHAQEVPFPPIRFDEVYDVIFNAVRMYRKCEDNNEWPKNPAACDGKYSPCEFCSICWPDQFKDAKKEIEESLVRREITYG